MVACGVIPNWSRHVVPRLGMPVPKATCTWWYRGRLLRARWNKRGRRGWTRLWNERCCAALVNFEQVFNCQKTSSRIRNGNCEAFRGRQCKPSRQTKGPRTVFTLSPFIAETTTKNVKIDWILPFQSIMLSPPTIIHGSNLIDSLVTVWQRITPSKKIGGG
jgi:hypothetical protein